MIPSLTGCLTNTKLRSLYGDVGQDGLFILRFNVMSELMFPSLSGSLTGSLTGKKLESLYGDVGQHGLFIFRLNVGIDVPQPNWHKVCDVSLFGGVAQCVLFIFIVKCK